MKVFKELTIILLITFISALAVNLLNLPLSTSVVGIFLLLALLLTNVVKEHQIKTASDFLSNHLIFFYIPSAVAIIEEYHYIIHKLPPFVFICLFTTVLIMVSTALTAQLFEKIIDKSDSSTGDKQIQNTDNAIDKNTAQ